MLYRLILVIILLTPSRLFSDEKGLKSQIVDFFGSIETHGFSVDPNDWKSLFEASSEQEIRSLYFKYLKYIDQGRVKKSLFQSGWNIPEQKHPSLKGAGLPEIGDFNSQIPEYHILKSALDKLKWWRKNAENIFDNKLILFKGDQGSDVEYLSQWLLDIDLVDIHPGDAYSQVHLDALTDIQLRFNLMPDGRLGKLTRQALLAITNQRINRLQANLERLRWLPHQLTYPYLWVDIAGFEVSWVTSDKERERYRAIVGTEEKQTPIFQDTIDSFTVNPVWKVPHKIAAGYLLRYERSQPGILKEEDFHIYENWNDNAKQLSIDSVNWKKLKRSSFKYRLEQQPGPKNRLGRYKLNMLNRYGVYLHDTDKPDLFEKNNRFLSSGCARVEGIELLIERILEYQGMSVALPIYKEGYTTEKIMLSKPVPVYFVYFTAWPDETGRVRFRDDIYELDRALVSWF